MNKLILGLLEMTKLYEKERFASEVALTQAEEAVTAAQEALELEVNELEKLRARKNGNMVEASFTAIELERAFAEVSLLAQKVEKLYLELKEEKKPAKSKEDLFLELTRLQEEHKALEKEAARQREQIELEEELLDTIVVTSDSSLGFIKGETQRILHGTVGFYYRNMNRSPINPGVYFFDNTATFVRKSTEDLEKTQAFFQDVKLKKWRV